MKRTNHARRLSATGHEAISQSRCDLPRTGDAQTLPSTRTLIPVGSAGSTVVKKLGRIWYRVPAHFSWPATLTRTPPLRRPSHPFAVTDNEPIPRLVPDNDCAQSCAYGDFAETARWPGAIASLCRSIATPER